MGSNVCLIIPPSPFLLDERVFMSLGVLKVAAALERAGVAVEVLDLSGVRDVVEAVRRHARSHDVAAYGVTATSPQMPAAAEIAEELRYTRSLAPLVPRRSYRIILGGPHATLVNAAWKRNPEGRAKRALEALLARFDVIVAGDGEKAIFDALTAPRGAILDADDRRSPYWVKSGDESPFPARHLVDVKSYRYQIDGEPALSLIAQLGCPFGCGFCAGRHSPMLRHIRRRSIQSIIDEMTRMHLDYGTRGFMFYDDELNVSPGLVDLMDAIALAQQTLKTQWRLRGFIKAELFTDAQAQAMARAGFRWLLIGFESGSDRILENINKKATRADNTRAIEIAHRHGLKVKALMSLGHPGESRATAFDTARWLTDCRPDDFDLTVITPYPGSPYYDDAEPTKHPHVFVYRCANGDALYQREVDYTATADYYKGAPGDYVSHVWTDELSADDLVYLRDYLEREVRDILGIPFNQASPAIDYEHSMGQSPRQLGVA